MAGHYPITQRSVAVDAASVLPAILTDIRENQVKGPAAWLPAVVMIAETSHSGELLALLRLLRETEHSIRPRIWPAFVAGNVSELADFDAYLDEAGAGLCDVVLALMGAPSPGEQAGALGAWLHVKMPAPASVLGELPDSQGRTCRYVALGSANVEAPRPRATREGELAADPDVDVVAVAARLSAEIAQRALTIPVVAAAQAANGALADACSLANPAAILRADKVFAEALTDVDELLPAELGKCLSELVAVEVGGSLQSIIDVRAPAISPAMTTGPGIAIDQATSVGRGTTVGLGTAVGQATEAGRGMAVGPGTADGLGLAVGQGAEAGSGTARTTGAERTDAVSALVLMTSKGGFSKLFGRGRIAAATRTVEQTAADDLRTAIDTVTAAMNGRVAQKVEAALAAKRGQDEARLQRLAAEQENRDRAYWGFSIEKARSRATIWTKIEAGGIWRAWGGPVPAPRRYLVGPAAVLSVADEREDTLKVVDLRDAVHQQSPAQIEGADAHSAENEHTVLLVAQYGLPLAALR